MKTIAIFCDSLELPGATFENDFYWDAYSDLLLLLKSHGVAAYFVTDDTTTYMGGGLFTEGFTITEKVPVDEMERVPYIRADVVFNRGDFAGTDIPVINPPELYRLGNDKVAMYEELGAYQAFSRVCHSRTELQQALEQMKTELVVVKDPVGSGGKGVYIGSVADVLAQVPDTKYPLLAQEFMDTSVGVPGYVEGIHDLRIEIGNGEIWGCYIRTPKAGEYRANLSQGGTAHYISPDKTPAAVAELARRIDARFGSQPRFYAADFANTPEGWKLIELNHRPGIGPLTFSPEVRHTLTQLARYLARVTRTSHQLSHYAAFAWPVAAVAAGAYKYKQVLDGSVSRRKRLADA